MLRALRGVPAARARGVVGAERRGRLHVEACVPVQQGIAESRMCPVECAQHWQAESNVHCIVEIGEPQCTPW